MSPPAPRPQRPKPNLWQVFVATLKEVGIGFTAWQVMKKVVPPWLFYVRSCYLMVTDLPSPAAAAETPDPQVRWATPDDVAGIAAIMWDAERIGRHLDEGSRVVVLEDAGTIRACSWFRFGAAELDHWLHLAMPADGVYSMYTFVARDQRGRGAFGRLVRFGNRAMADHGIGRVFNIVDRLNRNSWRARERTGGYRFRTIFAIGVFGLMAARMGDRWHIGRWTPRRRLRLTIDCLAADGN